MMMMNPKAPTKEEAVAPTWVWWDIKRCPVPPGVDARRVGPCIKGALRNLGYTGPLTITAIGILSEVPPHVLQKLCSTGIALKHVPTDISGITVGVFLWSWKNPPPANIMLISGEEIFRQLLLDLERGGYNNIQSIVTYDIRNASPSQAGFFVIWNSLLEMLRKEALPEEEDKCSETDEPALICSTCEVDEADMRFPGFDCFITHLNSREHALKELLFYPKEALEECSRSKRTVVELPQTKVRSLRDEEEPTRMMMMNPKAPTKDEAVAATWVCWDINRCPVPPDVDARRVGPCIKGALRNLGYTGQITITAIGILSEVPPHVLQKLCSTGITLMHVPTDSVGILDCLDFGTWKNPPPANIMLISGERIYNPNLADLKWFGYNIIRSIVPYIKQAAFPPTSQEEGCFFLWNCLLAMLRKEALQEEEEKCSETDEPALICSTCEVNDADMRFQGFDSLITHLNSMKHAMKELQCYPKALLEECAPSCETVEAIQNKLRSFREGRREAVQYSKKKDDEETMKNKKNKKTKKKKKKEKKVE